MSSNNYQVLWTAWHDTLLTWNHIFGRSERSKNLTMSHPPSVFQLHRGLKLTSFDKKRKFRNFHGGSHLDSLFRHSFRIYFSSFSCKNNGECFELWIEFYMLTKVVHSWTNFFTQRNHHFSVLLAFALQWRWWRLSRADFPIYPPKSAVFMKFS